MKFRTVYSQSLNRHLSSVMAAPASMDAERELGALLDEYRTLGGDCLHLHGEGGETRSREATGRWIRKRELRSQMFVCTAICHAGWNKQLARPIHRLNPASIADDISTDLALLRTDYLDLVCLSEDDPSITIRDVLEPLIAERKRGRIRAFGVSEWTPDRIREANSYARRRGVPGIAAVVTTELALATPSEPLWPEYLPFDAAIKECAASEKLTVLAWVSDLNQGLCLYGMTDPVTTMNPAWVQRWHQPANNGIVSRVRQFARDHQLDGRQVNTAYVLNQPFPVVGIVGLGVPQCAGLNTYARSSQVILSDAQRDFLERGTTAN